jgi:putative oxidoreductase
VKGKEVDLGLLILRLGIGCMVFYYGSQKMLGLFGGSGFAATVTNFEKMGFPALAITLSIFAEFFGSLGLILGALTRVAALGLVCNFAVATWAMAKGPDVIHGITSGNHGDAALVFYPVAFFVANLAMVFLGAGKYSLDARLFGKRGK